MEEACAVLDPDEVTLRQAVKKGGFKFPVVVTTCGQSDVNEFPDSSQSLPTDCLLLLEDQVNICYAQIKVLSLEDEQGVREKKGTEYVSEYNRLIGKQYLIPSNLCNKVKIVHRPGTPRTYTNISQVLESLPRFMRAQSKLNAYVQGSDETKYVSKGTFLEITKIIHSRDDLLECTACNQNHEKRYFDHDSTIDFIAIDDLKSYTLMELMDRVLLPTVVKVEDAIGPNEVIVYDDELASQALLVTSGPLEVIGKKRRYFMVGWLRTNHAASQTVTCKRIMIPRSFWDKEMVRVLTFPSKKAEDEFCKKNFKIMLDRTSKEYEEQFYMIPTEESGITYLISSQAMAMSIYDDGQKVVVTEETDLTPIVMDKVRPDVLKKLVEKTKLGFGHIHNELRYFFRVKSSPRDGGQQSPATSQQDLREFHKSNGETMTHLFPTAKTEQATNKQPSPIQNPKPNQKLPMAIPIKPRLTRITSKPGNHEETLQTVPFLPPKLQVRTRSISEYTVQTDHTVGDIHRSASNSAEQPTVDHSLPPIPATEEEDEYDNQITLGCLAPERENTPAYQKEAAVDIQQVTRKNQTAKDFCEYTVNQVRECFKLCAMESLAQVCWTEKIDGAFLAS